MSLMEYVTPGRDKFEAEDNPNGLAFPCNVCKHRHGSDQNEPCRQCDYNLLAAAPFGPLPLTHDAEGAIDD